MQSLIRTAAESALSSGPHAGSLDCTKCHLTGEGGVSKELTWLDEARPTPEVLSTSTDLCTKCHPGQAQDPLAHSPSALAHPGFTCASCHDPHSTHASCTQSACHTAIQRVISAKVDKPTYHPTSGDDSGYMCGGSACHDLAKDVAEAPIYHRPIHGGIPCTVCHDASGLGIAKNDEQSWITISPDAPETAVVSHLIGREAQCSKCHSSNNPWGLVEILPGG